MSRGNSLVTRHLPLDIRHSVLAPSSETAETTAKPTEAATTPTPSSATEAAKISTVPTAATNPTETTAACSGNAAVGSTETAAPNSWSPRKMMRCAYCPTAAPVAECQATASAGCPAHCSNCRCRIFSQPLPVFL